MQMLVIPICDVLGHWFHLHPPCLLSPAGSMKKWMVLLLAFYSGG